MSADLAIHVLEGCTEEDLSVFFSTAVGSKWFGTHGLQARAYNDDLAWKRVTKSPQCWVGQVSWLKAGLLNDAETYIPDAVQTIYDLIGEDLPILDEALEKKILDALRLGNKTTYRITRPGPLRKFLRKHRGKRLFTVSW